MGGIPRVPDCFARTGGPQVLSQVGMPYSEGEPNRCTPQPPSDDPQALGAKAASSPP